MFNIIIEKNRWKANVRLGSMCLWQFLTHKLTNVPLKLGTGHQELGRYHQQIPQSPFPLALDVGFEFAVIFKTIFM